MELILLRSLGNAFGTKAFAKITTVPTNNLISGEKPVRESI